MTKSLPGILYVAYAGSCLHRPHLRPGQQHPSLLDCMQVLTLLSHPSLLPVSEKLLASGKLSVRGIRMQGLHLVSWSTATSTLHMLAVCLHSNGASKSLETCSDAACTTVWTR